MREESASSKECGSWRALIWGKRAARRDEAGWSRVTAGDWLRAMLERMRQPQPDKNCQPGRDLQATLRPYQVEGVNWLWFMTELGFGACLADDMGLGKTIQVIDLLLQRKRIAGSQAGKSSPNAPSLLVVPASLLGNWRQELVRFGPSLRSLFAHRSEIDAEELARVAADPVDELSAFDFMLTTYGLVRRQEWLAKVPWSLVILDEAQAIKNSTSAQARGVKKLPSSCRIVLTGTPVENHLGDLWSIFDFCSPGLLGTAGQFKKFIKQLNTQQDAKAYGGLRRLVRPYILRRMKTDPAIVPDLPEKTEMRTECGLSKKQAALYEQAVEELARAAERRRGDRPPRAGAGGADAIQANLQSSGAIPGERRFSRRKKAANSGGWRCSASRLPSGRKRRSSSRSFSRSRARWPIIWPTVFGRPGLVLARRHSGRQAARPGARISRRSRPAVLRHLAQGRRQRAEPDGRLARDPLRPLVEPGRRKPGHRPGLPHRPDAATCSSTNSSAAAPSKNESTP